MGVILFGKMPQFTEAFWGDGAGYGAGAGYWYGDGYGYGAGYGYGDGYGAGSGYGYGDGDGHGYGDGDGDGDGYGYGDGHGYGDGDGSGYGDGDRYGDGDGDGSGYGYGDGHGYGYGDGHGAGAGYGYGYGDGAGYWLNVAWDSISKWSGEQKENLKKAVSSGGFLAFWKSLSNGTPANGGSGKPVAVGDVQKENGPLVLCRKGTLHATLDPHKWKGDRLWIVALYGEVARDQSKVGALEREILGEVK